MLLLEGSNVKHVDRAGRLPIFIIVINFDVIASEKLVCSSYFTAIWLLNSVHILMQFRFINSTQEVNVNPGVIMEAVVNLREGLHQTVDMTEVHVLLLIGLIVDWWEVVLEISRCLKFPSKSVWTSFSWILTIVTETHTASRWIQLMALLLLLVLF